MRKRTLQKAVALLVCFVFLGLSASGLMAGGALMGVAIVFAENGPAIWRQLFGS